MAPTNRNAPCPCGSGRKYKHCCGAAAAREVPPEHEELSEAIDTLAEFAEGDEFSDLDLRTTVGPYIGRQFFESSYLDLRGEVGLVWVDEQQDPSEEEVADGAPD